MKKVVIFLVTLAFIGLSSNVQAQTVIVEKTSESTILRGAKLDAKFEWLGRNAESHNIYIVEVNANENIAPRTFEYKGAINITIILRGDSINRTIRLTSNGTMFTIKSNVTFILDNNITLRGHSQNTGNMVNVEGGIFKMNDGATITGNKGESGVYVRWGTFEMIGGVISENTAFEGGGVYNRGTFTLNGGMISGNTASNGGGVYNSGNFIISNGTISENAASNGGGISIYGDFEMNGGTISGNDASLSGGGVYVFWQFNSAIFNMRGGTITNNTATEYGGGVYVNNNKFTKISGTITGYNSDPDNGNVVKDNNGVLPRRGHAVYVKKGDFLGDKERRKETTVGMKVNLSSDNDANWDQ